MDTGYRKNKKKPTSAAWGIHHPKIIGIKSSESYETPGSSSTDHELKQCSFALGKGNDYELL